jgi:hypothetical protein
MATRRAIVLPVLLALTLSPSSHADEALIACDFEHQGHIYDVDPLTGYAYNPRPTGLSGMGGLAYGPNGLLYVLRVSGADAWIYTVDPATGAATPLGDALGLDVHEGDIDFDPVTGVLYGVGAWRPDQRHPCLFTVDLATGTGTIINEIGPPVLPINSAAMAFDQSGTLYVLDAGWNYSAETRLFTVDKATGALLTAQVVTPALSIGAVAGMDFSGFDQTLYVVDGGDIADRMLFTLDPVTAILTPIGDLRLARGLSGLEFRPPRPADPEVAAMLDQIQAGSGPDDPDTLQQYIYDLADPVDGIGTRVTGTPACNRDARNYLYTHFAALGCQTQLQRWTMVDAQGYGHHGYNVIADLPGDDPDSNRMYIMCGHYDTQPTTPGADDNATGTAAMMVTAKAIVDAGITFPHTLRFIAFSGEEQGELGSAYYALDAYTWQQDIGAVLNYDMAGWYFDNTGGDTVVRIYENIPSKWLTDFTIETALTYADRLENLEPRRFFNNPAAENHPFSDHFNFWLYGYDAVSPHEYQQHPQYHQPGDLPSVLKYDYAQRVARLTAATLVELNRQDAVGADDNADLNRNGAPDWLDIELGTSSDCNANGVPDDVDITRGTSADTQPDGIPDECQDCNDNGILDPQEIADCGGDPACQDRNDNGIPDGCETADCDQSGVLDVYEIADGILLDCDYSGVPDICEVPPPAGLCLVDCLADDDADGVPDLCLEDCDGNGLPDRVDVNPTDPDGDGIVAADCQRNGVPDVCDIDPTDPDGDGLVSLDNDNDGVPDECQEDCDENQMPDAAEIAGNPDLDLDGNGVLDACEDCNANGQPDALDIALGTSPDCNRNSIPDECEVPPPAGVCLAGCAADDNQNGIPDECEVDCDNSGTWDYLEIADGTLADCDEDGVPDVCVLPPPAGICTVGCSTDCNGNGVPDECDPDCDRDGLPDDCECDPGDPGCEDCNGNGVIDACDIDTGQYLDCNGNRIPDVCEIDQGSTAPGGPFYCTSDCADDCNNNGVPDDCEPDCDADGVPDACVIADCAGYPTEPACDDCNGNGIPDGCEIGTADIPDPDGDGVTVLDCNDNGRPDACDIALGDSLDSDGNGIPDECDGLLGDMNCDGFISAADIDGFVTALVGGPSGYAAAYPDCRYENADCNGDGTVSAADIDGFVSLLVGGP